MCCCYAEVVAVREEGGQFDVVPADVLIDLAPHPRSTSGREIEPSTRSPRLDHLKSTYQIEVRQRCQQDRQQYAAVVRDYLERSFKARINKAQERYMRLMAELGIKPEYKLATDEAKRHLDDLERSKKERLAGLDRLQIARTGPVRHLATAMVLPPDVEIATAMRGWGIDTEQLNFLTPRQRKEAAGFDSASPSDLRTHGGTDIRASAPTARR